MAGATISGAGEIAPPGFTWRLARMRDLDAIRTLMRRAIDQLQHGFLTPQQIALSHAVMGLDTQLIRDRTYFLVERDGVLAGCGGWSFRATLYGGDDSVVARDPQRLDPARDPARIRAMYTDPAFARQGVGRFILTLCEDACRAQGFGRVEMMATLAGVPLYRSCNYVAAGETGELDAGAGTVPLCRMTKPLSVTDGRLPLAAITRRGSR